MRRSLGRGKHLLGIRAWAVWGLGQWGWMVWIFLLNTAGSEQLLVRIDGCGVRGSCLQQQQRTAAAHNGAHQGVQMQQTPTTICSRVACNEQQLACP